MLIAGRKSTLTYNGSSFESERPNQALLNTRGDVACGQCGED